MTRAFATFALASSLAISVAGCKTTPTPAHPCDIIGDGGACVAVPTTAAVRSGGGAPSVACFAPPAADLGISDGGISDGGTTHGTGSVDGGVTGPGPGCTGSNTCVTLTGVVHALEAGPDTSGLTLQLIDPALLATGNNPAFVATVAAGTTTLDGTKSCSSKSPCTGSDQSCIAGHCWTRSGGREPLQRACDADITFGCVYALSDGCNHSCDDGLDGRADGGKYCRDDNAGGLCRDRLRWEARYSIDNVPTDRTLVLRISAPGNTSNTSWVQSLRWGTTASTAARACANENDDDCLDLSDPKHPTYRLDVTAMAQSDWARLPLRAGVAGGTPNGDGVIVGEVRDCDGVPIGNASVATNPAGIVNYFTTDPLTLTPDVTRATKGTDPLGRFAAWSVPPGRVTVSSAGLVGGEVTPLGRASVFVYGGSASFVVVGK